MRKNSSKLPKVWRSQCFIWEGSPKDRGSDMKNDKISNEQEELHGESAGNYCRNQVLDARCHWPVTESCSGSTSDRAQGGGHLGYCGSSSTFGDQLDPVVLISNTFQCNYGCRHRVSDVLQGADWFSWDGDGRLSVWKRRPFLYWPFLHPSVRYWDEGSKCKVRTWHTHWRSIRCLVELCEVVSDQGTHRHIFRAWSQFGG